MPDSLTTDVDLREPRTAVGEPMSPRRSGFDLETMYTAFSLDPRDPLDRGRLLAIQRHHLPTSPSGMVNLSHPFSRCVAEMLRMEPRQPAQRYTPPWSARGARKIDPDKTELTASETTWIAGLPDDPAKVSEADAVELERLHRTFAARLDAPHADRQLVEQAFAPVQAHRERLARASELVATAGTTEPLAPLAVPPPAPSTTPAPRQRVVIGDRSAHQWAQTVLDVALNEMPAELTDDEILDRVTAELSDRCMQAAAERSNVIHKAREAMAAPEIRQAIAQLPDFVADPADAA